MPTIKDIAKLADVSHGTVSNVLNGRGNVSIEKIKRVEQAAEQLGYQLNAQAKFLREGQTNTISVILPNITSEHYSRLYEGLNTHFTTQGYELSLYLTQDRQELELQFLQRIATKRDYAVITVSCLDNAQHYYRAIKGDRGKIIFVYRRLIEAESYISLNFEQAGSDIADAIANKGYRRIGLFTNWQKNTHSQSLKQGLVSQFKKRSHDVELIHIESASQDNTYSLAFNFFNPDDASDGLDAIITSDVERASFIRNASYLGSAQACPPIYTLADNRLIGGNNIYQYHMNYGMLSRQIVDLIATGQPQRYLPNKGFMFSEDAAKAPRRQGAKTLTLLTLPSPSTDAIKKLLPHFKRQSGIDVDIIVRPFNEIYHILDHLEQHQQYDIIRVDMAGLPWFAKSTLKPLATLGVDVDDLTRHYAEPVIQRYCTVHDIPYAIPFDPSIQMTFYRRDLFDDATIKRFYYEKYKTALQVPQNFEQFSQIAGFFSQSENPYSSTQYGSCVTLGNPEIIASEFLLRYYAFGGRLTDSPDHISLNPAVAQQTLTQFNAYLDVAKRLDNEWWDKSVSLFGSGDIAMVIVYMNLFLHIGHQAISPLVGFAPVPGQQPLLGGGSLGMSKYSQKDRQAAAFFDWLFSDAISEQIVLLGGCSARKSMTQDQTVMKNYPWLALADETGYSGIRENIFPDGRCINLRLAENIIGQSIADWIAGRFSDAQAIEHINQTLALRSVELIKDEY
jgi:multiple sugar transport system substrate-binding protein